MLRRSFFKKTCTLLSAIPVMGLATVAYAKKVAVAMVDPKGAQAKGLKYVDVSAVKGKQCWNCIQYGGEITHNGKKVGKCNLFPNKYVTNAGYCSVWVFNPKTKKAVVKKPATKPAAVTKPAVKK